MPREKLQAPVGPLNARPMRAYHNTGRERDDVERQVGGGSWPVQRLFASPPLVVSALVVLAHSELVERVQRCVHGGELVGEIDVWGPRVKDVSPVPQDRRRDEAAEVLWVLLELGCVELVVPVSITKGADAGPHGALVGDEALAGEAVQLEPHLGQVGAQECRGLDRPRPERALM